MIKELFEEDFIIDRNCWTDLENNKSKSPFSLYFYLKQFGNFNEAYNTWKIFQLENNPINKKIFQITYNKHTIEYWTALGYSEEYAKTQITKLQSKISSLKLEDYIKLYGENEGTFRFNEKQKNYANRKNKDIRRRMRVNDISREEAELEYNDARAKCTPRTLKYWIHRGYNEEDAKKNRAIYQSQNSKKYMDNLLESDMGPEKINAILRKTYDHRSLTGIMDTKNCSLEQAMEHQLKINKSIYDTCVEQELWLPDIIKPDYVIYQRKVRLETEKTYDLYQNEIDPDNKRSREYHLDHSVSIRSGFSAGISIIIMSSKYNLKIVPASENCSKNNKNSITVDELYERYNNAN